MPASGWRRDFRGLRLSSEGGVSRGAGWWGTSPCAGSAHCCAVGDLPTGPAAAMPAAAGPGLRRGSQSRPRAVRTVAAGPGLLPPALRYAAGGGRRLATPVLGTGALLRRRFALIRRFIAPSVASPRAQLQPCRPLPARGYGAGASPGRGQRGTPPPARGHSRRRLAASPAGAGPLPRRSFAKNQAGSRAARPAAASPGARDYGAGASPGPWS